MCQLAVLFMDVCGTCGRCNACLLLGWAQGASLSAFDVTYCTWSVAPQLVVKHATDSVSHACWGIAM